MNRQQRRQQANGQHRPDPEPASKFATVEAALAAAVRYQQAGKFRRAAEIYRKILDARPRNPVALHFLGVIALQAGRNKAAVDLIGKSVALKPEYAEAHNNLGCAFTNQGKHEEAAASYQKAIALKPGYAEAHSNLGSTLRNLGRIEEAIACYRKATTLNPNVAEVQLDFGGALVAQGRVDEALACYRRAIALKPNFTLAHGTLLDYLHYIPSLTLEEIFAEHRRWNAQHAAPLAGEIVPHTNVRDPDRRIRVGFVSGSLRHNAGSYMITPALEARNGAVWELYIYFDGRGSDDHTERIRAAANVWREIGDMDDDAVAQLVREDKIDILVALSGHASVRSRHLVFARKPAPVQVKWVGGQVNTTGMDAMDYFLSDPIETPEGAEKWFSEEVIRLPDGYACYAPPKFAPEVAPLPALDKGYVTFGCFNRLAKVNGEVVALWARLLHRLPAARLVLKTRSLGDAGIRERYQAMFEAHAVARERVDLLAGSPHAEMFAHYNGIDIALDPFPYSGCLTTYESLWMGVPVITLPGETFAGRHSASHLHNVGLDDWVVGTEEEYLALAERWSRDVAALADLRAGLRARMAVSPLCDGPRFARNLEAAFRAMWRRWCDESGPPVRA